MKTADTYSSGYKRKNKGVAWCGIIVVFLLFVNCENFTDIEPPETQLVSASVFEDDQTAVSVLTGIYTRMMTSTGFASGFYDSVTVVGGLYADELVNYGTFNPFFDNEVLPDNSTVRLRFWSEPYQYIYTANTVLEALAVSDGVSEEIGHQLKGEALFIRAFCYFYLVNFFGDVPLHLTTDYRENATRSRTPEEEVYKQMISDLKEAQTLLSEDYSFSDGERTRPNAWAATALLSRVYLYVQDWTKAEEQSSAIIGHTSLYELNSDLSTVFLKNSKEAIWQLMPVQPGINTWEGYRFILSSVPPRTQGLSNSARDAFEPGDYRKDVWIGSITDGTQTWYYPDKYKIRLGSALTEYSMVFRLAEQYLVRAEARAQQGNITGAQQDLNVVRNRAGLENTIAVTQAALQDAVMHERRTELFAEWGHRWLDLKRTGRADNVLTPVKPGWDTSDIHFPIPQEELLRNPNITPNH